MIWLTNLVFGFTFSFIGSIPPGTINLSVIQLGLQKRLGAAFRMAFAAAFIEFFYAAIAIKFQMYITSNPAVQDNFQLITSIVLLALGGLNLMVLFKKRNPKNQKTNSIASSGFRKGILLSIGNPLAMPFWIAVTAYLQSNKWVNFEDTSIWTYVLGISLGTIAILMILGIVANKTGKFIDAENKLIKIIPGIVLVVLGLYSLANLYIFS